MVSVLSPRRIKLLYNKFHHTKSNRVVHLLTANFLAADKQVNFVVQFHTCLCVIVLLCYTISRLPQLQNTFQLVKCFIKSPRM